MKNKHAAMEMSVGTIVTIVLLMSVLVLGIFLVQRIFTTSTSAIDQIDSQVENEINKLFASEGKKLVIYPSSREITIKKGDNAGFGFSIRNIEQEEATFSYKVSAGEVACSGITKNEADGFISLGKSRDNIMIPSGDSLENPILVKFRIPETASLCNIRYNIDIQKGGNAYLPTTTVDLEIK